MTLALPKQKQNPSIHEPLSTVAHGNPGAAEARHLAHDARNWLTVLQVYCDLLRTSGTVTGNGRKWIEELSSAVERGHGLVASLLDSAQTSGPLHRFSAAAVVTPRPLDLAAAIERRLPLFRQIAGDAIQVEFKSVAHAGTMVLQKPEFERILLNLVRNAIEAMPQGGRLKIALECGHSCERRSLVLRVSDTGNGIVAEFLPHIFDSGFSTKLTSADPLPGRGFGLAIVRELAMGAGGTVRVRSRVGHGTSFAVELPLLPLAHPSEPRSPAWGQRKLAIVSEMPKSKTGRRAPRNNCDANRKGTRVPC